MSIFFWWETGDMSSISGSEDSSDEEDEEEEECAENAGKCVLWLRVISCLVSAK